MYFVRYGDPDALAAKANQAGFLDKLMFWKADEKDKPEQYRIAVAEAAPQQPRDRAGSERRARQARPTSEKILALLHDQLK